jgi:hypothetical protein
MKAFLSRPRSAFSIRRWPVLLGILALLAVASIVLWKFYSTAPYCRVTVVSIDVDEKAHLKLEARTLCSSGATDWYTDTVDGVTVSSSPSRDWSSLRPLSGAFAIEFDMQRLEPDHPLQSLAQRATEAFNVKVGETYQVTPDRPLLLYRLKDKDGRIHERWLEVSK